MRICTAHALPGTGQLWAQTAALLRIQCCNEPHLRLAGNNHLYQKGSATADTWAHCHVKWEETLLPSVTDLVPFQNSARIAHLRHINPQRQPLPTGSACTHESSLLTCRSSGSLLFLAASALRASLSLPFLPAPMKGSLGSMKRGRPGIMLPPVGAMEGTKASTCEYLHGIASIHHFSTCCSLSASPA